jgi:transcriptional regulator with XRE-family HTH domain
VTTTERRAATAARAANRIRATLAEELRTVRIGAGLSQADVARVAGISKAELSRIERGRAPWLTVDALCRIAAPLGLDVSVRLFPAGEPIRDRAQQPLLGRLRARMAPLLRWQPEAGIPLPGDRRAWDAMIHGPGWRLAVEAESRLHDIQALERRIALKARDDGNVDVLLLVNETRTNRAVLGSQRESLRALLPVDGRAMLAALAAGEHPGGSGIVVL